MRKVLSFVLVLTLVLGSFSMAFAGNTATTTAAPAAGLTDISGNANADAIQVAYDLGIVTGNPDGTYLPAKAVNRAEFAALITRALDIPDSALAGYTSTSFKDTAGYSWAVPYLAFAQSKGIMLGDGNGNVMPGRTITMNEAMTMALRAIGYTANSSLLVGTWPANYVSIAQNSDMYKDVAATTTVDKASAAQIIYNLLTVQKVAVDADGTTNYLWKDKAESNAANLINTNLGCTEKDNAILGVDYTYDNSVINITDRIGDYGNAYVNSDGDLVAFTSDATALTGKVDGANFKVGDTKYDFGANTVTDGAFFANTDDTAAGAAITKGGITNWAAAKADGGETVTIYADLSGKKIKDIYSVVAWKATDAAKASSSVQDDIADNQLLSGNLPKDDSNNNDLKGFALNGVASLDKIAKDNVVYTYEDKGGDIRRVDVGTEKVDGNVDEIGKDFITVGGKDYNIANVVNGTTVSAFDVNDSGTFFLDANGKVFSFDGTGATNTYGVIKSFADETSFDNFKVKLYKSDDSSSTLNFNDAPKDISWITAGGSGGGATKSAVVTGALVGYSLDNSGEIDTMNVSQKTALTGDAIFQSSKILTTGGVSYTIASDAVVFTYDGSKTATSTYDMSKLADVKHQALVGDVSFILNNDGDVAALFIDSANVKASDDSYYGVFNTRTKAVNADDTNVYKLAGYIDGTAFTKYTDDRDVAYDNKAGVFGVYKITIDTSNVITDVQRMDNVKYSVDTASGYVANDLVITSINSDKTIVTGTAGSFEIAPDAVVYKYDADNDTFTVSKLSALRKDYTVSLYDTKGDKADGVASVVIYQEN